MSRAGTAVLRALFPQRMVCHACGDPLTPGEGLLCATCASALARDAFAPGDAKAWTGTGVACAAGAYPYRGTAEALLRALKFGGDHTAALPLAEGMAGLWANVEALRTAEICLAVPVHARRLRRRGYNQAEVLAAAFAEAVGLTLTQNVLVRLHHQRSLVGQGRAARRASIAGAFAVGDGARAKVLGRRVLLVDDVLTTGATAEECARVLLAAGAQSVAVLTACRA